MHWQKRLWGHNASLLEKTALYFKIYGLLLTQCFLTVIVAAQEVSSMGPEDALTPIIFLLIGNIGNLKNNCIYLFILPGLGLC